MAKTSWKAGTMLYPLPPVMVTCGTMDKPNVLTVAWTGIVNSEPAMTYISVRPSRYSHELISENQEFVINLTTAKTLKAADFCGVKSGRDVNKFAETGLTPVAATTVKAPLIAESPLSLECRVTKVEHLGSHDMFLAEIVAVDVDDEYLDADGKFRLEDSGLIAFCHGGYYALGGKVGSFGFSVEKKKSRKQHITEIKHERRALKKQLDKAERKAAEKTVDHSESVEGETSRNVRKKDSRDVGKRFEKRENGFEKTERKSFARRERKPFKKFEKDDGDSFAKREKKPFEKRERFERKFDKKPFKSERFDREERDFDKPRKPFKKTFGKKPADKTKTPRKPFKK